MNTLNAGNSLNIGQTLVSDDHVLIMQHDGNLVLYQGGAEGTPTAVWATATSGQQPAFQPVRADLQEDGNFVLYSASKVPAWTSSTEGNPGSKLVLQDSGNLVIYDPSNQPLWASNTNVHLEPAPTTAQAPVAQAFEALSTEPVRASKETVVGMGKTIKTDATLYRDGRLVVNTYTQNDNWAAGLRGHVFLIGYDVGGRAILVSQDHVCTTRCSVPDLSCASRGTNLFTEAFPAPFGQYTMNLDIYHSDGASFANLRETTLQTIRGLSDIAQELKDAIVGMFG
jgi:hypothetical protein